MKSFIRVWRELEIDLIPKQIIIAGQISGSCGNCNEIGLDYTKVKFCPKCNTEFKFISLRQERNAIDFPTIKKIQQTRDDLIFIDYNDFKRLEGKLKAKEFFE